MQTSLTERYKTRRGWLAKQIIGGAALIGSSGVAPDRNLFDKNLRYLTGVAHQNAYLLLAPQGVTVERAETLSGPELGRGRLVHEILFVEELSAQAAFMDGDAPTLESLRESSGVDRVLPLTQMESVIERLLDTTDTLYFNTAGITRLSEPLTPELELINRIRERFYWVNLRNCATMIHQMRGVKDEYEVACLRKAFEIQTGIFEKIMQTLKPGENESLGEAIFDYETRIRAAEGVGGGMADEKYTCSIIVGAGKNSITPHYHANNAIIQDGDLVLIDSGITVDGYSSDITRTFPANGKFTPRQRELYNIVLEAELAAIATMKPGSTMLEAHQAAYNVFQRYDLAQYGYGNCGHPVGLSIHDPNGCSLDDREQPFEPGVVVVIEPFLMLPHEGMGIRIEDGVLITETGHEVLAGPPKDADAVEALCRRS